MDPAWLLNRLRGMSPAEILSRLRFSAATHLWKRRKTWHAPEADVLAARDSWTMPVLPAEAQPEITLLLAEAEGYLQGHYHLLNHHYQSSGPDWHLDHVTGTRAPLDFGPTMNYRDPRVAGDIKNIWELSRHRQLTVMAVAYAVTKDDRFAMEIERQLRSWVEQNPFPLGLNWHSSLELGVRLTAWVWIERLLRGSGQHSRLFGKDGLLWPVIYWHQWFIERHLSSGSSANNHLIGEVSGLFIAAVVWPVFRDSGRWEALSRKILEAEAINQTYPSGINRELAFSYHRFALELFLLPGIEAERAGRPFSPGYRELSRKMTEAIPALTDVGGNRPHYGDEDGGTALQLRPLESSWFDWVLRLGQAWSGAAIAVPETSSGSLAASLVAVAGEAPSSTPAVTPAGSLAFADAGLYLLTSNRSRPDEIFCIADAGPLGFLSIAAHGHADALSFTMSVGGRRILVDPGTGTYFADRARRDYFRGTPAHNTITLGEADQSEHRGPFLWSHKAQCTVREWTPDARGGVLVAEHDGYQRLRPAAIHRRRLQLEDATLTIVDHLSGAGSQILEWRLHFAPWCRVQVTESLCTASWEEGALTIELDKRLDWQVLHGSDSGGWYSAGFNQVEASPTLCGRARLPLPLEFTHLIRVDLPADRA